MPANCPCGEIGAEESLPFYQEEENRALAYCSALTEAEGYCKKSRLEEIMDFARKLGYQKLGLAFCLGLQKEARILSKILVANGFSVSSVICKVGSVPKECLGLSEEQKLRPGSFEPICNPIMQARLLNEDKTELNLMLGLCVGHDSLFFKHSDAPVTVFAVKDRVLAHNPLGALYLSEGYYQNKLYPEQVDE